MTDGITPYVTGGMQRHSYHLVKNLLNKGVEITLFHCVYRTVVPSEDEVLKEFNVKNDKLLKVFGYVFPDTNKWPGHYIRASKKYSKLIAQDILPSINDYDFIYAKGYTAWELMKIKKQQGKKVPPISVKFHGYEMFQPIDNWREKLKQLLLKPSAKWNNLNADYVFSYGGEITEIIQNIGVKKSKIIDVCSGISDDWLVQELKPKTNRRKFLFIGRNERRKGIQDLLAIKNTILNLNSEFFWVGPIPENLKIKSDNCTYFGEVKEVQRLKEIIDQCDILVTPSHSEGMPNVILEAMARGLAVIATNVGAVPMMVNDTNGVLIEPFVKAELKKAIQSMDQLDNLSLLEKQKNSLSLVRENFLWSSIAEQHISVFKKILENNG